MQKLSSLIICLAVIGCASRPDTAPIENATNVPNYLLSGGSVTAAPAAPALAPAAPENATMGSLNNDSSNTVKPLPVTQANTQGAANTQNTAKVSPATGSNAAGTNNVAPTGSAMTLTPDKNSGSDWMIPTAGKADGYTAGSKGIDIYGTEGQAIYAAHDGKVVYSGSGLKGYGNLIIIKHDSTYLTAYAHNKINLVKEGATVKRGQQIAQMGVEDDGRATLHFELRKKGKPIDPFTMIKGN